MKRCIAVWSLFGSILCSLPTLAQGEKDYVDFSDRITPTCELIGLVGIPPEGWFNVPIDSVGENLQGCQMMRTDEQEELVGILRLLSRDFPENTPEETWFTELLGLEVTWLEEMGITLGEPLWRRDDVPMTGTGWEKAKAIGLSASGENSDITQEVHFLAFGGPTTKYLFSLATPAQAVDEGVYYKRNTDDFGVLIRTLQFPTADQRPGEVD
jgi:hypothetical protein